MFKTKIEFEDLTLREASGNYEKAVQLMKEEGSVDPWMLRSAVSVAAEGMTGNFIINFWNDGKMVVDEILRPASLEIPNDDIVELSKWAGENGWQKPQPSDKMLNSPRLFEFWERQYQSGLISCSRIEERESDLFDRLAKSEEKFKND